MATTPATNTATSPAAANIAANSVSEEARRKLSGDFDTFLLMLTTQLKNQDPLEPMDSNEFTQQLVQFAGVEQAIDTNNNLEKLIEMQNGTQINNAVNYIGKFVTATGNSGRLVDGVAAFSYDLPKQATTVDVVITNDLGAVVFKGNGTTTAGLNDVLWDGTNNVTGTDCPDGTYHIAVLAKDANGAEIKPTTYTTGFVTSVNLEDGETKLAIGKIELGLDKVLSVRDATSFMASDE